MKSASLAIVVAVLMFLPACDSGDNTHTEKDDDAPAGNDSGADDSADDDDAAADDDLSPPYEFAPSPSEDIGVFVATTGDDANPGTMAAPKRTITAGVELAETVGKSVFVAAGIYEESVASKVSLFGGYDSAFQHRDISNFKTVIAAIGDSGVSFDLERTLATVYLEGFTVRESRAQYESELYNTAGVDASGGHLVLSRNTIYGGSGQHTAGIRTSDTDALVISNNVYGTASTEGYRSSVRSEGLTTYGDYLHYEAGFSAVVIGNVIDPGATIDYPGVGTSGLSVGAGVAAYAINNVISGGTSPGPGTRSVAVEIMEAKFRWGYAALVNNLILIGTAPSRATAYDDFSGMVSWYHNDFWGDEFDCYMVIELIVGGEPVFDQWDCLRTMAEVNQKLAPERNVENFSEDPLFVAPGDFHLSSGSPCIGTGMPPPEFEDLGLEFADGSDPAIWLPNGTDLQTLLRFDMDGETRPHDFDWDIGPDEWRP